MNKTIFTFVIATIILGFCALTTRAASACDHRVVIINQSDFWVTEVYATNSGSGYWGHNRITNPICPHCQSIVTLNDGSGNVYYDILAVAPGAGNWDVYGKYICIFEEFTLYN